MKKRLLSSLITGPLVVVCMFVFSGVAAADTVYVDPNGSADFTTIQAAIDDVGTVAGDVVIVMPGTYVENINMSGKAITLRSTDPLDGGVVLATIIDGGALTSVIICSSGEEPNTVISGFVITNGDEFEGGGMYNYRSSPSVTNCTFSGNKAVDRCGGMSNIHSSPTVTNCMFSGNTAEFGGGMCNSSSSPTISNCTFSGNSSDYIGGGMFNEGSSPTLTNCTFIGNTASADGGGMYNSSFSTPTVTDSYFCSNTPDQIFGAYTDNGGNNMEFCPPPAKRIEGDIDADGDVDWDDFALMAANWLEGK